MRQLIAAARQRSVVSFDGTELAVLEWEGDDDLVLFAHATGFHKEMWTPVVAACREAGVRATIVAYDARGHGASTEPPDLSIWDHGRDVGAVRKAFGSRRRTVGVGHSLGGNAVSTSQILHTAEFDQLILIDPAIMPSQIMPGELADNPWAVSARRRRATFPSRESALSNFSEKPVFATWKPGVLELYVTHGLRETPTGVELCCRPEWEARTFSAPDFFEVWPRMPEIEAEITLITGTESVTHWPDHAEASAAHFGARHVRLEGVGHLVPMEAPEAVATEVVRALDAIG